MSGYYPPVGFHFRVDFAVPGIIGDEREGRFQEVSGLEMEINVVREKDMATRGEINGEVVLPDGPKKNNLTFKRGMFNSTKMRIWFEGMYYSQKILSFPVTVTLLNEQHVPLSSWLFVGSWPSKWSWSNLDADKSELVMETLVIQYDSVIRLL